MDGLNKLPNKTWKSRLEKKDTHISLLRAKHTSSHQDANSRNKEAKTESQLISWNSRRACGTEMKGREREREIALPAPK
jgi:hypothetical protein